MYAENVQAYAHITLFGPLLRNLRARRALHICVFAICTLFLNGFSHSDSCALCKWRSPSQPRSCVWEFQFTFRIKDMFWMVCLTPQFQSQIEFYVKNHKFWVPVKVSV
jgi:hypothetical protein